FKRQESVGPIDIRDQSQDISNDSRPFAPANDPAGIRWLHLDWNKGLPSGAH
ncbi:hypothetical protein OXX79_000250, partial [Metschnikowia pulcherrima]